MSFPRYERYRDSGVGWLGEVPQHWSVSAIKRRFVVAGGSTPKSDNEAYWDGDLPWVTPADLGNSTDWTIRETQRKITQAGLASCAAELVPAGTVILSTRAPIGSLGVCREPVCTNQGCKSLVKRGDYLTRLLAYVLTAAGKELNVRGKGTTFLELSGDELGRFPVPEPPLSEQQTIVDFLDNETAKIDALVEEQQRLIELLEEKRQAVISHAVTKGLDPNATMKDSGVEWLGDVPAHWITTPLKHLTAPGRDIMYGIVLPGPHVGESGVPIVKGGDVRPHRLRLDLLNRTTPEIEAPYARARLRANDVVYSIRGSIGDAELVPAELTDANITQDVARVSPAQDVNCRWLLYALKSRPIFVQLEQRSLGAAVRGINIFDLKRARVPLPPQPEQAEIADFLDAETASIDALVDQATKATVLLQERRAALISAAVTGNIDVRGLASAAPDAEAA